MLHKLTAAVTLAGLLLLAGCGDEPKPVEAKKEMKKPAVPEGPIPALTSYYDVYKVVRNMAPDLQTASITGQEVEGQKSANGKYYQWKIIFVSASKKQAYTFLYSTVEQGNVLKGLNNQGSMPWGGANQNATPFGNSDFSVDSEAAYTAAAEKAGDWLKKNADKPITEFALGYSTRFPAPTWYIQWGTKTSGFAAFVNASTGKVLK